MIFIVAEAGVNHNGDINKALDMIDVAADAGADAVKFQTFDPEKLEPPGPAREFLRTVALSRENHQALKDYCGDRIEFMSTAFDVESLRFLIDLGIKRVKISSGGLADKHLLAAARDSGLPIMLSTGTASAIEICQAMKLLKDADVTLLHCVSSYPVPIDQANVGAVESLKGFGHPVGYSDHTLGITAPVMAVALWAVVIEKHFTLDRNLPGPDHKASLEPDEFKGMVNAIRAAEQMLGDGVKRLLPCEHETMKTIRRRRAWSGRF